MSRTPQTSIRFNPEKLNLIKARENLETAQKVVDYLVDAYWWQNKLNPASKTGQPATEFQFFEIQVKEADEVPVLELLKWNVLKNKSLSQIDKRILMEAIAEKINKFKQ